MNQAVPNSESSLIVMVCCAQWCGVCRDFKAPLAQLAQAHPAHEFVWLDIEDTEQWEDEFDIENFPTVLICSFDQSLYFQGPVEPHIRALGKLLEAVELTGPTRQLDADTAALVERIKPAMVSSSNNFTDLS